MGVFGAGLYGAGVYGAGELTLTDDSSDDKLQARYLSDRRGVLLKANFAQTTLQTHNFESTTESFAVVGTGTLTRNTTTPLAGTGDLKLAWTTGTGTRGVSRTYTGGSIITGPKQIRIQFTIRTDDPLTIIPTPKSQEDYWSLRVRLYEVSGKFYKQVILPRPGANTTRTNWFADFYIDSGKQIGKFEILLDNTTTTKNLWLDNITIVDRAATKVRFTRQNSNDRVRGGDPAVAVDGIAYAYDDELTPGVLTLWYAEPIYPDGDVGAATGTVEFTIEDRSSELPSHMIKSMETPGLLLYLATNQKDITRSRQASFVNKEGDGKPAGGISSAYSISGDYQLITLTIESKEILEEILEEAVLYIQPPGRYNRKPFYATVTSYSVHDVGKMSDPEKIFNLTLQEVERPPTSNSPNFLPLRDYTWLSGQYATYGAAALTALTYDQLAFSAVP